MKEERAIIPGRTKKKGKLGWHTTEYKLGGGTETEKKKKKGYSEFGVAVQTI